ncbi:MAG: pilin [Candidatus Nomurabacteria bacterium]|nr:pilin [Candidatus Nomurabacteria bacterium]
MKKNILLSLFIITVVSPFVAFAADLGSLIFTVNKLLNQVIPVLIALATVYFIWGVIQYTMSTDEEAKTGARAKIIQGLIGLFVIVAFWGIVGVIANSTGVGPTQFNSDMIPCVPYKDFNGVETGC